MLLAAVVVEPVVELLLLLCGVCQTQVTLFCKVVSRCTFLAYSEARTQTYQRLWMRGLRSPTAGL